MRRTQFQTQGQNGVGRDTKPKAPSSETRSKSRTSTKKTSSLTSRTGIVAGSGAAAAKTSSSKDNKSNSKSTTLPTASKLAPTTSSSRVSSLATSGQKGSTSSTVIAKNSSNSQKASYGRNSKDTLNRSSNNIKPPIGQSGGSSTRNAGASLKKSTGSPYAMTSDRSRASLTNGPGRAPVTKTQNKVPVKPIVVQEEEEQEEYDYDDDFEEDYESDFEEDMSESVAESTEAGGDAEEDNEVTNTEVEDEEKTHSVIEFEILEQKVKSEYQSPKKSAGERNVIKNGIKSENQGAMGDVSSAGQRENSVKKDIYIPNTGTTVQNGEIEIETEEDEEVEEVLEDESEEASTSTVSVSVSVSVSTHASKTKDDDLKIKAQQISKSNQEAQMSYPMFPSTQNNQKTLKIDNYSAGSAKGKNYGFIFESDSNTMMAERKRSAKLTRGRMLQSMIKLDSVAVEIFHMDAVEYSRYMLLFASKNSTQVGTQTAEDNLEQETQTDDLDFCNKWTQKPPSWSTLNYSVCDANLTRQEALGVGCDDIELISQRQPEKQFNFLQNFKEYSNFVSRASDLMLSILELDKRKKIPLQQDNDNPGGGNIKLTRGLHILKKLEMHTVVCHGEFAACSNGQILQGENGKKYSSKNMITVWYLREPSMPRHFLRVWSHVTALQLNPLFSLVVCGNADGSLNFWNLKDASNHHTQYQEQTIRTPCVNTSCMGDDESNHTSKIVALEILPDNQDNYLNVLSLDGDNILISWSCIRARGIADESSAVHFAPWSTFHVTMSKTLKLTQFVPPLTETRCFAIWKDEENLSFLLGTNYGYIMRGTFVETFLDSKPRMEEYVISQQLDLSDFVVKVTCIDINHRLSVFAACFEDGFCRLFALKSRRCFLTIDCDGLFPWKVKWSEKRPPVLYIGLNDRLEVWDLLYSDLKPWKSLQLKKLKDFALSTSPTNDLLITLIGNDLSISPITDEVKVMTNKDEKRLQDFLRLLYDCS